jgi:hypothetical protein
VSQTLQVMMATMMIITTATNAHACLNVSSSGCVLRDASRVAAEIRIAAAMAQTTAAAENK